MKKISICILLSVCLLASCKNHTLKQDITPSSGLEKAPAYSKDSINRKDEKGLKQGTWVEYGKNGKPVTELHFKNNCLEGNCKAFDGDGNLSAYMQYTRDTLDGEFRNYTADGRTALVRFYIMGVLKATKHFGKDGKVEHITLYDKDGNVIGNENGH